MNIRSVRLTGLLCASVLFAGLAFSDGHVDSEAWNSWAKENVVPAEQKSAPAFTMSFWCGAHDWKEDIDYVDTSVSFYSQMRAKLGKSPFDIDFRWFVASTTLDDSFYAEADRITRSAHVFIDDVELNEYGASLQVLLNLNRGGAVNPYLGVGAMYAKSELECELSSELSAWGYRWVGWTERYSEDGFTYVARAGLEFNLDPIYIRAEASVFGETYSDDETAQGEFSAIFGVYLTDNLRLDLAGDYYTEWKEYDVLLGLSIVL